MKWELFKNRLNKEAQQEKHELDIDAIWGAIEPEVDRINAEKRKRRPIVIWWWLGAGVFGLLLIGLYQLQPQDQSQMQVQIQAEQSPTLKEEESSPEFKLQQETPLVSESDKDSKGSTITSNQTNNPNYSEQKNISRTDFRSTEVEVKNKMATSKMFRQNRHGSPTEELLVVEAEKTEANATANVQENEIHNNNSTNSQSNVISKAVQPEVIVADSLLDTEGEALDAVAEQTLLPDSTIDMTPPLAVTTQGDNGVKNAGEADKGKVVKKKSFHFLAGLQTGLSYANRKLTAKDGQVSTLLENRKNYESSLETTHVGFFAGLEHKSGLRLTTGLQRTDINERYNYKNVTEETVMVEGVEVRRINLEGDTIDVMGLIPLKTTTTIDKNIYNKYILLDIPVLLSYHRSFGKWSAGVEAGILANLSLKTKGIIPNAMLEDVNIKSGQSDVFKSKIGLGYQFGLSMGSALSDRIDWSMSPTLRWYPGDFMLAELPLSQKYVLLGANLGLIYHFE